MLYGLYSFATIVAKFGCLWNGRSSNEFTVQEAFQKDTRPCDCCGLITPCKSMKKLKGSDSDIQVLCKHCAKVQNCLMLFI